MSFTYADICSGISAPTMVWRPLGWKTKLFSEIDKFPNAVLAHHYPEIPNYGDFTKIKADAGPVDLLVGGTPCQSFSVAGHRLGLDDPRGNLALEFLALAQRLQARWFVWENVPGVFSSFSGDANGEEEWEQDSDFATFLSYAAEGGYGCAYRVFDTQYTRVPGFHRALPQRRRRVIVVGHIGDWRRAAAVLLEPESLLGDTAPRREAGQNVAGTLNARTTAGGGLGTDFDLGGGLQPVTPPLTCKPYADHESQEGKLIPQVANPLTARMHKGVNTTMDEGQTMLIDPQAPVAFVQNTRDEVRLMGGDGSVVGALAANPGAKQQSYVTDQWGVRRLTPAECARLQGFPDDFCRIPWRGKPAELCPDGPQYKAYGNSMSVNVMAWIGKRIDHFERLVAAGCILK